ncbi:hypothetical protein ACSSS7_007945 [Eimeria intestinalis]
MQAGAAQNRGVIGEALGVVIPRESRLSLILILLRLLAPSSGKDFRIGAGTTGTRLVVRMIVGATLKAGGMMILLEEEGIKRIAGAGFFLLQNDQPVVYRPPAATKNSPAETLDMIECLCFLLL